jgi:hypothetical protein
MKIQNKRKEVYIMRSQKGSGLVVFTLKIVILILILGVAVYAVVNNDTITGTVQTINTNSTNEEMVSSVAD